MKRPEIDTVIGPISMSVPDAARRLMALFTGEFRDTYLSRYYAQIEPDPDNEGGYTWCNEDMDLAGADDLFRRLARDGAGRWSCDVNLGFAPASLYPSLFRDPPESSQLTLALTSDQALTRFVEEEPGAHVPFALFLVRVAQAVGAPGFVSGLEPQRWSRLSRSRVLDRSQWQRGTYVAAWRRDVCDEEEAARSLGVAVDDLVRTTMDYTFATFFPEP